MLQEESSENRILCCKKLIQIRDVRVDTMVISKLIEMNNSYKY